MASSTVVKNDCDGSLVLASAAAGVTCTARFVNGDLSIDNLAEGHREVEMYESRGVITSVRKAGRKNPTVSFSVQVAEHTSASANDVIDACYKRGAFLSGTSAIAGSDVWGLDLTFTVEGTDRGDSGDHTVTITGFHPEFAYKEGRPNTVTVSGTVYGAVTFA